VADLDDLTDSVIARREKMERKVQATEGTSVTLGRSHRCELPGIRHFEVGDTVRCVCGARYRLVSEYLDPKWMRVDVAAVLPSLTVRVGRLLVVLGYAVLLWPLLYAPLSGDFGSLVMLIIPMFAAGGHLAVMGRGRW